MCFQHYFRAVGGGYGTVGIVCTFSFFLSRGGGGGGDCNFSFAGLDAEKKVTINAHQKKKFL